MREGRQGEKKKLVSLVVETSDGTREHLPVPEKPDENLPDLADADLGTTGPEQEAELQEARQAELNKMLGF
jgi:hypothetical protein